EPVVDLLEKRSDLVDGPVMHDPPQRKQIRLRERIREEIARDEVDPRLFRSSAEEPPSSGDDRRQIEDRGPQIRITFARFDAQVSRRAAEVDEVLEAAEIECGNHA